MTCQLVGISVTTKWSIMQICDLRCESWYAQNKTESKNLIKTFLLVTAAVRVLPRKCSGKC